MRNIWLRLAAPLAALLLAGCVYDPYVGGWVPCCTYGYGYGYRYPPPYSPYGPYGYPYGAPSPSAAPEQYQGAPAPAIRGGGLAQRFAVANTAHDGRLTRAEAERGMPLVASNFDAIDIDGKGYVTLPEVRAFMAAIRAQNGGGAGPEGEE